MPEKQQDVLTLALIDLEKELTSFGSLQNALKDAHQQLTEAEQKWASLTKEQQKTALDLVDATKKAIANTNQVTAQTESLTGALIPLAKAIEQVNFPLRLDKIDLGVSTQASTMAAFQGAIDRGFKDFRDEADKSKKRDTKLTIILFLNTVGLLGFIVYHIMKRI
ncbi:MAG: hypothetical protein WCK75_10750 [Elusimicrobiota bacterium]